jgi:hypothetical protein
MKELIIGESSRTPGNRRLDPELRHRRSEEKAGRRPESAITVDTPVPYRLSDVTRIIDDLMGNERPLELAPYMHQGPLQQRWWPTGATPSCSGLMVRTR